MPTPKDAAYKLRQHAWPQYESIVTFHQSSRRERLPGLRAARIHNTGAWLAWLREKRDDRRRDAEKARK